MVGRDGGWLLEHGGSRASRRTVPAEPCKSSIGAPWLGLQLIVGGAWAEGLRDRERNDEETTTGRTGGTSPQDATQRVRAKLLKMLFCFRGTAGRDTQMGQAERFEEINASFL